MYRQDRRFAGFFVYDLRGTRWGFSVLLVVEAEGVRITSLRGAPADYPEADPSDY